MRGFSERWRALQMSNRLLYQMSCQPILTLTCHEERVQQIDGYGPYFRGIAWEQLVPFPQAPFPRCFKCIVEDRQIDIEQYILEINHAVAIATRSAKHEPEAN